MIEIPSSGHIIERAYGWPLDRAIDLSIEATLAAKEAGLYTVFFTIDSSRAEFDWYLDLVERVATEGHMDALALVDTFGGVTPQAIPVWVREGPRAASRHRRSRPTSTTTSASRSRTRSRRSQRASTSSTRR